MLKIDILKVISYLFMFVMVIYVLLKLELKYEGIIKTIFKVIFPLVIFNLKFLQPETTKTKIIEFIIELINYYM